MYLDGGPKFVIITRPKAATKYKSDLAEENDPLAAI